MIGFQHPPTPTLLLTSTAVPASNTKLEVTKIEVYRHPTCIRGMISDFFLQITWFRVEVSTSPFTDSLMTAGVSGLIGHRRRRVRPYLKHCNPKTANAINNLVFCIIMYPSNLRSRMFVVYSLHLVCRQRLVGPRPPPPSLPPLHCTIYPSNA